MEWMWKNSNSEIRLWRLLVCNINIDYSATSIRQWSLPKWGWWICYFPEKWWKYSYSVAMLPIELYGLLMIADRSFPIVIMRVIRQLIMVATVTRGRNNMICETWFTKNQANKYGSAFFRVSYGGDEQNNFNNDVAGALYIQRGTASVRNINNHQQNSG